MHTDPSAPLRLVIARDKLQHLKFVPDPDAPDARPLLPGQARMAVEHFALTANNITYAAFGQSMHYWQFFPAPDSAWGCLPVWGFAQVLDSQVDGLARGQRCYGYFPAGSHLVVQPGRVSARGFVDTSAHRVGLPAAYNAYSFCDGGAAAASGPLQEQQALQQEGLRALLQPLFMTAFLLDDFLASQQFFGARQLLLSSASSKTAIATAWCLAQRRGTPAQPAVLGLTSPGNKSFVQGLGLYEDVLTYDELRQLDQQTPSVYVDFAGSAGLRSRVHQHFGDQLTFSSAIGGTHWQDLGPTGSLPGPRPSLFFAPAQAALRASAPPAGWGRDVLDDRLAQSWQHFVQQAAASTQPWVKVVHQRGMAAVEQAYRALLDGKADPLQGAMLSLA